MSNLVNHTPLGQDRKNRMEVCFVERGVRWPTPEIFHRITAHFEGQYRYFVVMIMMTIVVSMMIIWL